MPRIPRTIRDRDLSDILKRLGPLTNKDLAKEATKYPHFNGMTDFGIEKAVDRFVRDYENLGIVVRDRGKIDWLPPPSKAQKPPKDEPATIDDSPSDSVHMEVRRLLQGMANGSIVLRDKSPHKELNKMKGEIYDGFMADIDFYNLHRIEFPPQTSRLLETRIYNTALKLRAYGFIEDKKEQPQSTREAGT